MAEKIYLGVVGGLFVASGLFAFIDPQALGAWLGIGPVDPSGMTEIRATYGGLVTGIGLLLIAGLRSRRLAFAGLAVMVFGVGALALTRLLAEVFGSGPGISPNQGLATVFELLAAALGGFYLRRALRE